MERSFGVQSALQNCCCENRAATADLKYPFAGVALSFKEDESNLDLSTAATIKLRIRTQGVVRMAILNQATLDADNEGGEPGYLFHPSDDYQDVTVKLDADSYGDFVELTTPDWAYAWGKEDVLKAVRGIKFEAKMSKGGYAEFDLTSLEILDASGATVATLQGLTPIPQAKPVRSADLRQVGNTVEFNGFESGARAYVYDMGGRLVSKQILTVTNGSMSIDQLAPSAGIYTVKVKDGSKTQLIRIRK